MKSPRSHPPSERSKKEGECRTDIELENRTCIADLADGAAVSDLRFDNLFPEAVQRASQIHWTPVDVARRAAELLDVGPQTRVLDIGSGAGKFCMVGALTTPGHFTGVEQRPHLVTMAKKVIRQYHIPRVDFISGGMEDADWTKFTGFYIFNPFIENLFAAAERIDQGTDFGHDKFITQVRYLQMKLTLLPVGTHIVTFHGFGGEMPPGFEVKVRERWGEDYLVLLERVC